MTAEEIKAFDLLNNKELKRRTGYNYNKIMRTLNGNRLNTGNSINIEQAKELIEMIRDGSNTMISYLQSAIDEAENYEAFKAPLQLHSPTRENK